MNTLDFLRRVLPSQGPYVALAIKDKKVRQQFVDSIEDLDTVVNKISDAGLNAYYAVASFITKDNGRKQDNVSNLKSLYLDIDCGEDKPYKTQRDGVAALVRFVKESKLPKPLVISSGNGLHAYWILDRELTKNEWQPLADALKSATQQLNFDIDLSVPADSARVLRPVGTVNTKGGAIVDSLLITDETHNVEHVEGLLKKYCTSSIRVIPPRPQSTGLVNLETKTDFPPTNHMVVAEKCPQVQWATTHQAKVSEPLWYALIGVAAHCVNPEQVAVEWSQSHPDYDYDKTIAKLEHWKKSTTGPTTCTKFRDLRPSGCDKCRFKDRINSPCLLGLQHQAVEVSEDAPDAIVRELELPRGYKRTNSGIKFNMDGTDIDICPFDVYPVSYGRDETLGYETVRYKWNRQHVGWQPLSFRQAFLADGSLEFAKSIADQGIVLLNKAMTEKFQMFLRGYMNELRKMRTMTNLHSSMGWKENHTQFVLGDTVFRREANGTVSEEQITIAQASNRTATEMYTSAGDLEKYIGFTSVIDKAKLPIQGWAMLVGMAAPLFEFTGIKGITVNLYGPTGSGKSLAQYMLQSVWGNPDQLHYTSKFTQNALYSRMGLYNNLPMTIDETTTMAAKDIGEFLYDVSQGKEKSRLTRSTEERQSKTWRLPCVTSSNKSMSSMLMSSGLESDAQMMRLFEVTVHQHPLFIKDTEAGKRIHTFVMSNYGLIGREIIRKLMQYDANDLKLIIASHRDEFMQKYQCKFVGSERFWEQTIILADLIGKLAIEWGLIRFDYARCTETVVRQLAMVRKNVQDNVVDTFDLITEYLNDNNDTSVTAMHTSGSKVFVDTTRLPRGDVRIRYDLFRKTHSDPFDKGVVLLDRAHFKRWLATNGADIRNVLQDLIATGVDATPAIKKAYLAKDTSIKLGQTYVIGINLKHPRLEGILTDKDDAIIEADLAGLTVIKGGKAD
jgi:hypothetical protein